MFAVVISFSSFHKQISSKITNSPDVQYSMPHRTRVQTFFSQIPTMCPTFPDVRARLDRSYIDFGKQQKGFFSERFLGFRVLLDPSRTNHHIHANTQIKQVNNPDRI
jgi:hypothetical protein